MDGGGFVLQKEQFEIFENSGTHLKLIKGIYKGGRELLCILLMHREREMMQMEVRSTKKWGQGK